MSRLAPSAIYDLDYRVAIVALVFERFAKPLARAQPRKMSAARLKLLQFMALRPWLLPAMQEWSHRGDQSALALNHSIRVRRGFLSDSAHDEVMEYLIACGIFMRADSQIVSGVNSKLITNLADFLAREGFFASERKMLEELDALLITNDMLEGW